MAKGTKPKDLESATQLSIVKSLRGFGAEVLINSTGKMTAATPGIPDLSVRSWRWPQGIWLLMEVKNQTGELRPEQEVIFSRGGSYVVRSQQEAIDIYQSTNEMILKMMNFVNEADFYAEEVPE